MVEQKLYVRRSGGQATHRLESLEGHHSKKGAIRISNGPLVRCRWQLLWFSVRILFLLLRPALLSGCAVVLLRRRGLFISLRWPGGAGVLRGLVVGCIGVRIVGPV